MKMVDDLVSQISNEQSENLKLRMTQAFQSKIIHAQQSMAQDVKIDGFFTAKLEKELSQAKAIAKAYKKKIADLEKQIEKLNGHLSDYNYTLKLNATSDETIKKLNQEIERLRMEKEKQRKTFH